MSNKIFFLVGEGEYHSERTMPPFAEQVARELGYEAVLSVGEEADPLDLSLLDAAALLVICVRFRNPTPDQLRQLHDWFASGRPAVGLRTTSHAFSNARGWCPDYFGGHYMSHAPNQAGTLAVVDPAAAAHPIVRDLPRVTEMGYGGAYNAVPLADTATPLMFGKTGELPAEPVAWINRYTPSSRVFFTSLGSAEHFAVPTFTQLLRNGIAWCLGEGADDGAGAVPRAAGTLLPPPPRRPPHSATVLFTGAPLQGWRHWDPGRQPPAMRLDRRAESTAGGQRFSAARWPAAGNVLTAVPGHGDIVSEARFRAHRLHLDFQLPREPEWLPGTLRGTGGVFVTGRYEIEIRGPAPEAQPEYRCGALNGLKAPDVDAAGEPGRWQELEMEYTPEGAGGRISVWLNGDRIHHNVALTEPTPRGFTELPEAWQGKGPLRLQADASPVRYANIWVSE
jgi:type 1 glutamine amidotransferase